MDRPSAGPDSGLAHVQKGQSVVLSLGRGAVRLLHGELLAQGEILDRESAVTAAEEREQPKQVEQESDQRAGSVSGSEPTDQRPARRPRFWRRTAGQAATTLTFTAENSPPSWSFLYFDVSHGRNPHSD